MRYLLGLVSILVLGGCASVPSAPARAVAPTQVEPVSEVVLLQCNKFQGAVVTVTGGEVVSVGDVKAARAIYDALPEKARAVVETGTDLECAPSAAT